MSDCDCFLVLGHVLNADGTPRQELVVRLEMALVASQNNPEATLVVSGGGRIDGVTEAELMKRWLTERGVSGDKILVESASRDTVENIVLSTPILVRECAKTVGLITGVHHMLRAACLFSLHLVGTQANIRVSYWPSVAPDVNRVPPEDLARERFLLFKDLGRMLDRVPSQKGTPRSETAPSLRQASRR